MPLEAHVGTRLEFLARHEADALLAARDHGAVRARFLKALFRRTIDTRNLLLAAEHIRRDGGRACGDDSVGPDDLDQRDWQHLAKVLHRLLRSGQYGPGTVRSVRIPKASGNGVRTLSIPLLADRVVQRAIVQAIQPFLDPQFRPTTLGGRPGQSTQRALALAAHLATAAGCVLVTADVANAFDVVPHTPLLEVIRTRLGTTQLTDLIDRIVRAQRTIGIAQGGALSPLLLNVFLDALLDQPWRAKHPHLPLIRWVDDVLILCPDQDTATAALAELAATLAATGMPLKQNPAPAICDLNQGAHVRWLGYAITSQAQGLAARIDETAWNHLDAHLQKAHHANHPTVRAQEVIMAWINTLGPAFSMTGTEAAYQRIRRMARTYGFEELPTFEIMRTRWQDAHRRYTDEVTKVQQELDLNDDSRERRGEEAMPTAPPVRQLATLVPSEGKFVSPQPCTQIPVRPTAVNDTTTTRRRRLFDRARGVREWIAERIKPLRTRSPSDSNRVRYAVSRSTVTNQAGMPKQHQERGRGRPPPTDGSKNQRNE